MSAALDPAARAAWSPLKLTLVVLACILAAPVALMWVAVRLNRDAR